MDPTSQLNAIFNGVNQILQTVMGSMPAIIGALTGLGVGLAAALGGGPDMNQGPPPPGMMLAQDPGQVPFAPGQAGAAPLTGPASGQFGPTQAQAIVDQGQGFVDQGQAALGQAPGLAAPGNAPGPVAPPQRI